MHVPACSMSLSMLSYDYVSNSQHFTHPLLSYVYNSRSWCLSQVASTYRVKVGSSFAPPIRFLLAGLLSCSFDFHGVAPSQRPIFCAHIVSEEGGHCEKKRTSSCPPHAHALDTSCTSACNISRIHEDWEARHGTERSLSNRLDDRLETGLRGGA